MRCVRTGTGRLFDRQDRDLIWGTQELSSCRTEPSRAEPNPNKGSELPSQSFSLSLLAAATGGTGISILQQTGPFL